MSQTPQISIRAKLVAAAVAVVVAFVLCEIGARLILPTPPAAGREPQIEYISNPELGFFHAPNQAGWLDDGWATINSLGLR